MDTKQFIEICQRRHAEGESFQTITNDYPPATKPAIRRVCLNGAVPRRLAQAIGLDPTPKQLRDRARRKAQREELVRLRRENADLKTALVCEKNITARMRDTLSEISKYSVPLNQDKHGHICFVKVKARAALNPKGE